MDSRHYAIALFSIAGVGSVTYKKLIGHFKTAEAVFGAKRREFSGLEGLGEVKISAIASFKDWGPIEHEILRAEGEGITIMTLEDDGYPKRLREVYDAPPILYLKGSLEEPDALSVAVVGSRNSTRYGIASAEAIARGLAERGVTVVSGMARGIDSAAHIGALKGEGRTIAVLGSGIDVIYPPENRALYDEIVGHGAVITEFPMGTGPEMMNFPRRNRIISGISLGVVIVEASPNSGALITAQCALEQNREVFAVPGNITSMRSRGTHKLIRQGAKLVETADDVIEELRYLLHGYRDQLKSARTREHSLDENLSGEERVVLKSVEHGPACIDAIIEECGLRSEQVLAILLDLEMKGLVKRIGATEYTVGIS